MNKHIHSFLSIILFTFFCIPAVQAQIELSSNGNAGIGTSPNSNNQLRVHASSNDIAIYGRNTTGSSLSYGVYGYVSEGFEQIGVYGKSIDGYTNYGVYGSASGGVNNWAGYFSGSVYTTGSYSSSDERFKKEIVSLDNAGILIKVLQLQPRRYQFYNNEELTQRGLPELNAKDGAHFGLVAQELEQIFPELVMDVAHILEEENGEIGEKAETITTKAINYQELTVVLLSALQELQQKVETLEAALNR